ncbi:ParB/RepB/Spo0J family partition protein [Streptomyces hydrogenans]|uniref:ParB/RepB/Spo0J family partition protein n=1 Tax=Streptomyces hydrogenans TaxID=1873719 RepID=UPI0035DC93A9
MTETATTETATTETATTETVGGPTFYTNVRVEEIGPNPNQPRRFFDEAALKELADSIMVNGLLQPIVIRPFDFDGDTEAHYMIIAGERRWRACQMAGIARVDVRILSDLNEVESFILSVTENVNREDMTIMEEAGAYADLMALSWDAKKIASQFGKTETHIKWRIGLLTLREEVAAWVTEGKIKPNLAWHIAQLNPANQMITAMRYLKGDFDSEADAANFAQGLRMMESQVSMITEEEPSVEEKEKRTAAKKAATDKLGKIEEGLLPLLDELTKVSKPEDLADILGTEIGRYVRVMDRLHSQVTLARRMLRQAHGIAKAREVAWSEAVKAQQEAAPAQEPAQGEELADARELEPQPVQEKKAPAKKAAASKPAAPAASEKKPVRTRRPAAKKAAPEAQPQDA